jgi:branched-chain amino acid transport system ATP-binding protein
MSLVTVDGAHKAFGGLMAVRDVSFRLAEGELLALIGPNGAGKTTLFHLLSGFLAPDAGTIRFGGESLAGLRPHAICRRGMVRTFQITRPFHRLTVLENVLVGALERVAHRRRAAAIAEEVLALTGLADRADHMGHSLTLPDRKRLELARALATGPKVLLLDEVMAGLNPTEKATVTELVRRIRAAGVSVLIIEHAMRVIMGLSDRICVLNYGQCIATGDTAAVCADPKVIAAYIGT